MKYKFENKTINIPDEVIDNYVDTLEISIDEAIQMYLEEEGYAVNEEVEELTKKAKDNRITATIHEAKSEEPKAKREVVRKENPLKENIIQVLAAAVAGIEGASNIKVTNVGKLIEFNCGGESFKLDLVQRRKKKGE